MMSIKERFTTNNNESRSKCLKFLGTFILDKNNKFLNNEITLKDGTIVRFVNGLIDGNLYDAKGNIIEEMAAIEYPDGSQEFWTKGYPSGFPAVSQNMGHYEEDWEGCHIISIREEIEIEEMLIEPIQKY